MTELERHVRKSEIARVTVGVQAQLEEEYYTDSGTDSDSEYTDASEHNAEQELLAEGLGQSPRGNAPPPPPTIGALSEPASSVGVPSSVREDSSVAPPPPSMLGRPGATSVVTAPPGPQLRKKMSWLSPAVPQGTKRRLSMAAMRGNAGAAMHGGRSLVSDEDLRSAAEEGEAER